jgi:hypothetical protein
MTQIPNSEHDLHNKFDDVVKSHETVSGVIQANAGIQYFQYIPDSGIHQNDVAPHFLRTRQELGFDICFGFGAWNF